MTFDIEFLFAENHMQAVREAIGECPAKLFNDALTAPVKRDLQEATDLVMTVSSGDIAVRVRRNKFIKLLDWSIRIENKGHKTEIHKLQEGFSRWYFIGWSLDDKSLLADWYLLDMDKIRKNKIMERAYPVHDNYDGTKGKYIPIKILSFNLCIVGQKKNKCQPRSEQL